MDRRSNADDIYKRQLAILKNQVVPRLTKPKHIQLCARWIERLNRCQPHERFDRNRLLDELIRQLQRGRVDADLFGPTQAIDRLQLDKVLAEVIAKTGGDGGGGGADTGVADVEQSSPAGDDLRYLNMLVGFEIAANQLEEKLTQAGTSANALHDLRGLLSPDLWSEFLPASFLPELQRIEAKWLHVIDRLRSQIVENHYTGTTTSTSQSSTSTAATSTDSGGSEPVKYKRFALKSARCIERLRAELACLRRDQQLRACTESISNAALRTAWMCSTDGQHQTQLSGLMDAMIQQQLQPDAPPSDG